MIMYSRWVALPLATRNLIAKEFGIIKKGSVEVFSNTIKSDGYYLQDIEKALHVSNMQKFLNTNETDMAILFENVVAKLEGRLVEVKKPNMVQLDPKEAEEFKKEYKIRKNATKKTQQDKAGVSKRPAKTKKS